MKKQNVYVCQMCGGTIRTLDMDPGVTPFMIGCRADPDCRGAMQSLFYRVIQIPENQIEWVWRKPYEEETPLLSHTTLQHVAKGGLILRRAVGAPPIPEGKDNTPCVRCIICSFEMPYWQTKTTATCPRCGGAETSPLLLEQDCTVRINWLELRTLVMWAEQYAIAAQQSAESMETEDAKTFGEDEEEEDSGGLSPIVPHMRQIVVSIAQRLDKQRPASGKNWPPLTFTEEIARLREAYPDATVTTDFPEYTGVDLDFEK